MNRFSLPAALKGVRILTMLSAVSTVAAAATAQAATLSEIKAKGVMTVATEDSFRPFEYVDNGTPMGLDYSLLALLRKDSPFKIDQQVIPWTGLLPGVISGKYDVALTAAVITPPRVEKLDFTLPIADETQYYVIRKGEAGITSVSDLSGKTVGVQAGGASYDALPGLTAMLAKTGGKLGPIKQYTSFPEAYQDLADGRVDYVINGVANLSSLTKDYPTKFQLGEAVGTPEYAAWAVAKGNTDLLNYLDAFMTKVRADGSLYELQKKWLGSSFEDLPDTPTTH